MSTPALAVFFVLLVLGGGFFFFGNRPSEPLPTTHVMENGTVMQNTDSAMNTTEGAHTMPDGTMMENTAPMTAPSVTNTQITPKTVTAPSPQVTTSNTSTTSMPMDHSMMGHSM